MGCCCNSSSQNEPESINNIKKSHLKSILFNDKDANLTGYETTDIPAISISKGSIIQNYSHESSSVVVNYPKVLNIKYSKKSFLKNAFESNKNKEISIKDLNYENASRKNSTIIPSINKSLSPIQSNKLISNARSKGIYISGDNLNIQPCYSDNEFIAKKQNNRPVSSLSKYNYLFKDSPKKERK